MHRYPRLEEDSDLGRASRRKIAIVSSDIKGPIANGGVGTSTAALAEILAEAGHDVTLIFVNHWESKPHTFGQWQKHYAAKGLRLIRLPPLEFTLEGLGPACASYAVYLYLKKNFFDIVHFPDMHGLGYHTALAKKLTSDFSKTLICVTLHGPSRWHRDFNLGVIPAVNLVQFDFLERRCVEMADVLMAPSQYILNWARDLGWELPKRVYVKHNPLPEIAFAPYQGARKEIKEIVFFGRMEFRKGIEQFCDALEALPPTFFQGKKVSFLGCHGFVGGQQSSQSYLQRRSKNWKFSWSLNTGLDQEEALAYLRSRTCLVVLPSLSESMGYTLVECMTAGIPVIANRLPSYQELIRAEDHSAVLFDARNLADFVATLQKAVDEGVPVPRFNTSPQQSILDWVRWHSRVNLTPPVREPTTAIAPAISVLIRSRTPQTNDRCVKGLKAQSYNNFDFHFFEENALSLARKVDSEFLFILDAHHVVRPNLLKTLLESLQKSQAHLATCSFDRVLSRDGKIIRSRQVGVGPDINSAYFLNVFGSPDFLVRRQTYLKLAEKTDDNEWDFFVRALAKNFRVLSHPESLLQVHEDAQKTLFAFGLQKRWAFFRKLFSLRQLEAVHGYLVTMQLLDSATEARRTEEEVQGSGVHYDIKTPLPADALPKIPIVKDFVEGIYWKAYALRAQVWDLLRDYPLWPFRKIWWMASYQFRKRILRHQLFEATE
jgi:O-antigen biosynthesis protein